MDHDDFLPDPPVFDPELLRKCEADRFAMPLVFEWHKYVAIIAMYVASLLPDAPGGSRCTAPNLRHSDWVADAMRPYHARDP